MFALLKKIAAPRPTETARAAYIALVAHARNPFFYETLAVPDTLDGRFELIVLHLFLLQARLLGEDEDFSRYLAEFFFSDMDRSLREIGVSDTGVRYRIKAMAKAYHGRLQAYMLAQKNPAQLLPALSRNLYGTVDEGSVDALHRMARYIEAMRSLLTRTDTATIVSGMFTWPDPTKV